MDETIDHKPWEHLKELIAAEHISGIIELLGTLPEQDIAIVLSRLGDDERTYLLTLLDPSTAAHLIDGVSDEQAAHILSDLPAPKAGPIVDELPQDQVADVLGKLDEEEIDDILKHMEPESAKSARLTLSFPKDTAGNLMITDYLAYREDMTIAQVHHDMQSHQDKYSSFNVQYVYVTDREKHLVGVMRIHDLLFSSADTRISKVMIASPYSVPATADVDYLADAFERYSLLGLPVVDEQNHMLGIILPIAVEEARRKHSVKQFLWLSGIIGGEEFRTMPLYKRSGRRLSWLSLNIVLNIIAASVIALYQDTLAAAITLAVFLPMVSDMSGCSGNQAVAVSLRELSLGLLRPSEILRVAYKESSLGLINGIVLGLLLGFVAFLWKGNIYLSLVIGAALAGNTLVAVTFGGTLPLLLKRLKIDPALVSSPLLTTVTDMCGFFFVLSLASLVLPRLAG